MEVTDKFKIIRFVAYLTDVGYSPVFTMESIGLSLRLAQNEQVQF